jgi:hypothetical protein
LNTKVIELLEIKEMISSKNEELKKYEADLKTQKEKIKDLERKQF